MAFRTRIYLFVVVGAAIAILARLPWIELSAIGGAGWFGLFSFLAIGVVSEAMAVDFSVAARSGSVKSSIAFVPFFAAVLTFPIAAAVLTATIVMAVGTTLFRRRQLWAIAFNVAQVALSASAAAYSFRLIGEVLPGRSASYLTGFVCMAASYFAANVLLVTGYFAVRDRRSFAELLQQALGPGGGNLFYDLLASPVAVIAASLYREFYIAGLLLIILPLLLIRYSYHSKLQLQHANRDLLKVLIKAIETRDPYTSGHSVRVSTLARLIGEAMKLSSAEVERLETAALLHDIGKIDTVYAPIIRKPADLSDDERQTIRTHATKGAELLQSLTSLDQRVIRGVRHHHERYDGSGYPDGMIADQIPLAARIIMICDSIDAMLSDRPYRPALSPDRVKAELLRCSGTQFDPSVVQAILGSNVLERATALLGVTVKLPEARFLQHA